MNILLLLVPLLTLQGQQVERYGLVTLNGTDTASIETVTRRNGELTSEVLVPNRARLSVVATLQGNGCVTGTYPGLSSGNYALFSIAESLPEGF